MYTTRQNNALTEAAAKTSTILRNVYIWMTAGLVLTGIVALAIGSNINLVRAIYSNRVLFFGAFIAEFALVLIISRRVMSMSPAAATAAFAAYAILNGITLSLIFVVYTGVKIAATFFITAGTFGAMSVFAVTTKRDLTRIGNYIIMALIGLVIASVVNLFLKNAALYWIISYAGVLIFCGLTAWDTQVIKRWSDEMSGTVGEADFIRLSILGALKLYLDFINLFLFFLRIFGGRRS